MTKGEMYQLRQGDKVLINKQLFTFDGYTWRTRPKCKKWYIFVQENLTSYKIEEVQVLDQLKLGGLLYHD